jgi:hypothetical protein
MRRPGLLLLAALLLATALAIAALAVAAVALGPESVDALLGPVTTGAGGLEIAGRIAAGALLGIRVEYKLFFLLPSALYAAEHTRRLARRALRAAWLRPQDPRPPIILLRAFADDSALAARFALGLGREPWNQWDPRGIARFEESVVQVASRWGPVEALDQPEPDGTARRRWLPELGASRHAYANSEWRTAVLTHLAAASRIVLIVPEMGENIRYELAAIVERGWLPKLVLVEPPLLEDDVDERRSSTLETLASLGVALPEPPPELEFGSSRAVSFDPDGRARWHAALSEVPPPAPPDVGTTSPPSSTPVQPQARPARATNPSRRTR